MVHIEQQKIYCSRTCFQMGTSDEESQELQKLREENAELQCSLELVKRQVEKTRRRSVAFEEDVFDMEEYYKAELKKHKALIVELQQKLCEYREPPESSKSSSNKCDTGTQTILFLKSRESQTIIGGTRTRIAE